VEAGGPGGQLDVTLLGAHRERDVAAGKSSDHVDEETARQQSRTRCLHLAFDTEREPDLHVSGTEGETLLSSLDEDPAE
jgi:hypothetical protein